MDKKISIVMAYFNRKRQLLFTLETINNSKYENFEVIIVDDNSNDENKIDDIINNYRFPIKLYKFTNETKKHINSCIAYNKGFELATGDIIIIQNPECCHIGDVLTFVNENLKENEYISFPCYGLGSIKNNNDLYELYKKYDINNNLIIDISKYINTMPKHIVSSYTDSNGGWLNNINHFTGYHYLSAIYKKDLNKFGGFDKDYANGICHEDDDFIRRIYKTVQIIKTTDYNKHPFTIHQWHEKVSLLNNKNYWLINHNIYINKMEELNLSSIVELFIKPIII